MKKEHGFTVPELLVVISIIAIIIGFSIPALAEGRRRQEVRAAAEQLLADYRFAQEASISQDVYDADNNKVTETGIQFQANSASVVENKNRYWVYRVQKNEPNREPGQSGVTTLLSEQFSTGLGVIISDITVGGTSVDKATIWTGMPGTSIGAGSPWCHDVVVANCVVGPIAITVQYGGLSSYQKTVTIYANGFAEIQ